ncbi:MAG TPA: alanine--glyoxylate aminotransferase family protein [Anaerolineae bacterium]|nr:alanine--glyoxylate aminotransferase family protein [Anaerolineae bacterium]HIQ06475.1 alanine--glyoxylate aminotransferase family protein [Anaerolineae bacterium]
MAHVKLFIPGPTEVRPEVLQAQTKPMIGHRTAEFEALFARVQTQLRRVFLTSHRVYVVASSGSGLQEAAIRNSVRPGRRCLNVVTGAFGERWHQVTLGCGRETVRLDTPWGKAVKPEQIAAALTNGDFDAVTIVHNETSTGVLNPVGAIASLVRQQFPETLVLVDAVSSLGGVRIPVDEWGLDVCLTSSQKALALPPGLAFAAVSDRTLERAKEVSDRGWYFDFLLLEKYLKRNTTPATPALSLMRALDHQLDHMLLTEGLEARFARHAHMAQMTHQWAQEAGFGLFAEEGYRSPTVTCVENRQGIDVVALNEFLQTQGMIISNGYGNLKGRTFRIAHMGEIMPNDLEALFTAINAYLARQQTTGSS